MVTRLSGASVNTVRKGILEVKSEQPQRANTRIRKPGGGRKPASAKYPNIEQAIEKIIDGKTYGDPEKVIHWTTESLMSIAAIQYRSKSYRRSKGTEQNGIQQAAQSENATSRSIAPRPERTI